MLGFIKISYEYKQQATKSPDYHRSTWSESYLESITSSNVNAFETFFLRWSLYIYESTYNKSSNCMLCYIKTSPKQLATKALSGIIAAIYIRELPTLSLALRTYFQGQTKFVSGGLDG